MKFVTGLVFGVILTIGGTGLMAQPERAMHPRLVRAIAALRDARDYMEHAPHDFGGHKVDALRATDEAIRQLQFCLEYRERR